MAALALAVGLGIVFAGPQPSTLNPQPSERNRAPERKWTELIVRGTDVERCRKLARRFTDSPTQEMRVYDQGTVWATNKSQVVLELPFHNVTALCQIETTPRGLSPIGQLDLLSLVPEERCEDAFNNFVFHTSGYPEHFEHWKEAGVCAAWTSVR